MKHLYRVHDWDQHQHYKDRCPPWIKYHSDLLVNRKYVSLTLKRRAILDNLWLVASRNNGEVDLELEEVRFQIHSSQVTQEDIAVLIENGFFDPILADASTAQAKAVPETEERETEREGEENTSPKPSASGPPLIRLPTNKNGEEYPVTDAEADELQECYQAADVRDELRQMRGWLLKNKTRRKTPRGMPRFIATWLGKAHNQARASPAKRTTRRPLEERLKEAEEHDSKTIH